MGVPLEERREGRTSITPEFMEELESADTCRGTVGYLHALPRPPLAAPGGEMVMGAFIPPPPAAPCLCARQCCSPPWNFSSVSHRAAAQNAQPGSPPISSGCITLCSNLKLL